MYMPALLLDRFSGFLSLRSLGFDRSCAIDPLALLFPSSCLPPRARARARAEGSQIEDRSDPPRGSHESASRTRKRSITMPRSRSRSKRKEGGGRRGEERRGSRIGPSCSIKGEFTRLALDESSSEARRERGQSKQRSLV